MWHLIKYQILQLLLNVNLVLGVLERTRLALVNQIRSLQFYLWYIHETIQALGDVLMDLWLHLLQYTGQVSSRTFISFNLKTILARTCGPTCGYSLHGFNPTSDMADMGNDNFWLLVYLKLFQLISIEDMYALMESTNIRRSSPVNLPYFHLPFLLTASLMKMTIGRNGWSSKRIVQLISIPHSSGIDLVLDCRNCTICELETTFNSPEPKVHVW
jgi:hypothetical protein